MNCIWFRSLDCGAHLHCYTRSATQDTLKLMVLAQDTAADCRMEIILKRNGYIPD